MGYPHPAIDDLLLDSVNQAKDRYVIVQIGARHGAYLIKSSHLLVKLKPSLDSILIGVEASPSGYSNLLSSMERNGLNVPSNIFRNVAISDTIASIKFFEDGVSSHIVNHTPEDANERIVDVESTTIEEILKDVNHVDFLEMDIQGAEYQAIPCATAVLSEKVRMICIRTHGNRANEDALYNLIGNLGWQPVLFCYHLTPVVINGEETPLIDGILCWVNTNLREPCCINFSQYF